VHTIIRPHDVRLARVESGADELPGSRAVGRIRRVARLGASVKLDLTLPSGDGMTVHMPRREFEDMSLAVGDPVLLDLQNARVFAEDFAI
jgi:hypothetical protein